MSDVDAVREAVAGPDAAVVSDPAQLARDLVQALDREERAEGDLRGAVSTGDEALMADRARGYIQARREIGQIGSRVAMAPGDPTAVPTNTASPPAETGAPEVEPGEGEPQPPSVDPAVEAAAAEAGKPQPQFARGQEVVIEVDGQKMVGIVTSYRPEGETFLYVVRDDAKQMLTDEPVPEAQVTANEKSGGSHTGAEPPEPAAA